jgi:myo-inositol-1(or 4)-monophosphatase
MLDPGMIKHKSPVLPDGGWQTALETAVKAARDAGGLLKRHLRSPKKVHVVKAHDLKLELDVRCQARITRVLRQAFPSISLLGEEGTLGAMDAPWRWVVDPIDGTVNYAHQIPHACVSIALQHQEPSGSSTPPALYQTELGVVFDPFRDELWTAVRGRAARLNGRRIQVSTRARLRESVISLGFAKHQANLQRMLPSFTKLVHRVRKLRVMGSAALDIVYVASGRLDAYAEVGVRLWDIAAAGLILECAGGKFRHRTVPGEHFYAVLASNGRLERPLLRFCASALKS